MCWQDWRLNQAAKVDHRPFLQSPRKGPEAEIWKWDWPSCAWFGRKFGNFQNPPKWLVGNQFRNPAHNWGIPHHTCITQFYWAPHLNKVGHLESVNVKRGNSQTSSNWGRLKKNWYQNVPKRCERLCKDEKIDPRQFQRRGTYSPINYPKEKLKQYWN